MGDGGTWNSEVEGYEPDGYFEGTPLALGASRAMHPEHRVGDDYVPHFHFCHMPNADYQAVIDVLQNGTTVSI